MRLGVALAGAVALALGACTVGPEFEPVPLTLPDAYGAPVPALFVEAAPVTPWWRTFDDAMLSGLVTAGLAANLDVRTAQSRLREAAAVARAVTARTGPEVTVGGDARGEATLAGGRSGADDVGVRAGLFAEGTDTLDIFGGETRSRQAAAADAERFARLEVDVRRQVAAEIARTYLQLRAVQRGIALTEQQLDLQRQTVELVRNRVGAGLAPGLDLVRAEAFVATLEADLGPLRRDLGRLENALAVLLGSAPGALGDRLAERRPIPVADAGAPLGVPADLLRRRPDVQAAELAVAAATAEVGVATAALYPSFDLPAALRLGPFGLGALDAIEAVVASIGLLVELPIYDGGARAADITAAEERVVQATLAYRDTVLRAVEEVEAALLGYVGARQRRNALQVALDRNRRAFAQSQALYRDGFASFLDVLDSQRELTATLQDLARADRDVSVEVVNLHTALGGGRAVEPSV